MRDTAHDLEQSIQLALEAAAAANDTAEEMSRQSAETQSAADRLDKLGKTLRPALYGVLGGAVLSAVLGGLVYVRTLSDMRTATATQLEALAVFSKSVGDLQSSIDGLEELKAQIQVLSETQQTGFDSIEARFEAVPAPANVVSDNAQPVVSATGERSDPQPQTIAELPALLEEQHNTTRSMVTASISDLQLALSRMLASRSDAAPVEAPAPVAVAAPKPRPRPSAVRTQSRPKPKPAAAPANPFSYP